MKELDELTKTQLEIAIRKANEKHKDFEIDDSLVSIFIKMIGKRREGEQITPETLENLLNSIEYTKGE